MKTLILRFLELLSIALLLIAGVGMATSAFVLRVVLDSKYPRRPIEGVMLGIAMVMVSVKMLINRCR